MNKKMSKRQKDIKSKLMAAVCMLLVSSIMMVSTTYAWFTLSTAPEVKGISTAVGANGNLEMALMPLSGKTEDIKSDVGDSMNTKEKTLSNVTWGNLVDLKNAYGLEGITLYPSALNATTTSVEDDQGNTTTTTTITTGFPVAIPEYGVDGRVTVLNKAKAQPGYYNAGSGTFLDTAYKGTEEIKDARGVRAIGVASGASPAQLAYKAAIMNASQAATNAKNKAAGALIAKGGALADIAIRHVNGKDTYTEADVENLQYMLTALLGTEAEPGALLIIQNALKEYIVADYISKTGEGYETMVTTIRGLTTLDAGAAYIPAGMVTMITNLNTAIANATAAQEALDAVEDYSWDEISLVVNKLADPNKMNLNGFPIDQLTENVNALMKDVMNGKGIVLYLKTGAGVFVDIADFCGDYAAPVTIPKIEHEKLGDEPLENVEATMQTQSDVEPPYLTTAKEVIADAPGAGSSSVLPLSDFYGYIIDLAFRTNVAGSNLQLQTAAVDRIYTDSTNNEATMGGGSTMIFKSSDPNFTPGRMIELMKHLKVILFDPTNGEVIKNLVITTDNTEIITDADGTVTAPLYVAGANGAPATTTNTAGETVKDPTITALDQNTIKQISALVYLDGETLTNADVANAAQSMVGALNLQFSSSADLVPMEYADLKNGTVAAPTEGTIPEVTGTITPTVTVDAAVTDLTSASVSAVALTDAGFGFTVTGYDAASHVVAVTINGGTSVPATHAGNGAFACVTTETVESVAINITAATQG